LNGLELGGFSGSSVNLLPIRWQPIRYAGAPDEFLTGMVYHNTVAG